MVTQVGKGQGATGEGTYSIGSRASLKNYENWITLNGCNGLDYGLWKSGVIVY